MDFRDPFDDPGDPGAVYEVLQILKKVWIWILGVF